MYGEVARDQRAKTKISSTVRTEIGMELEDNFTVSLKQKCKG